MKKLFALIAALFLTTALFATEYTWISSEAKADFEGYDYATNFTIGSGSGAISLEDLKILDPKDGYFRFMAKLSNKESSFVPTNYIVRVPYPSAFNESGNGTGYINNAAAIKSIKLVGKTNRPYDEILLLYRTSIDGVIKSIRMPQDFNSIISMEEFTLVYENPLYEPDVNKRDLKSSPVLGNKTTTLEFIGFQIKCNRPDSIHAYSNYSIFEIKSVTIDCDDAFTKEQLEARAVLLEEFGIEENTEIKQKESNRIQELIRVKENEKNLMHKDETPTEDVK